MTDTTAPAFASASIGVAGDTMVILFTEAGSVPLLPASGVTGFSLTVNGVGIAISSGEVTGDTQITLSPVVAIPGGTALLSYTPGNVTDSAANALVSFSNQAVTNNSTLPPPPRPQSKLSMGFGIGL